MRIPTLLIEPVINDKDTIINGIAFLSAVDLQILSL